ncbi:hypothetical protein As57867_005529, partial [Aphanomyces stellatus]
FQRQLNYFGFRKWTKTQSCVCTFSHAQLNRYSAPDSMAITRKQQQHTSNTLCSPSSTDSNLVWSDAEDDMFSDQDMCAIELSDLDVKVDDWDFCVDSFSMQGSFDWLKAEPLDVSSALCMGVLV